MDKKLQTRRIIGLALMLVAAVLFIVAMRLPRQSAAVNSPAPYSAVQSGRGTAAKLIDDSLPGSYGAAVFENKSGNKKNNSKSCTSQTAAASTASGYSYPINLNTATADELMSIKGIGESRAYAILEYRDYLGKYKSVEQIKDISGIGEKTYEKVSPYLTV